MLYSKKCAHGLIKVSLHVFKKQTCGFIKCKFSPYHYEHHFSFGCMTLLKVRI